ncbi:MAG: hypothetical protein RLZZ380_85 [Actinomycetota bacterium]
MDSSNNCDWGVWFPLAISVTSELEKEKVVQIVNEIFEISSAQTQELTPRTKETLFALAESKRLITASLNGSLIGWVVVEKLEKDVSELGMAFVKPEFRRAGVLHKMLEEASKRPERLIIASYSSELIEFGIKHWGARKITLWQVALVSRGRFITKRLNPKTSSVVNKHLRDHKPLFVITDRRKNG